MRPLICPWRGIGKSRREIDHRAQRQCGRIKRQRRERIRRPSSKADITPPKMSPKSKSGVVALKLACRRVVLMIARKNRERGICRRRALYPIAVAHFVSLRSKRLFIDKRESGRRAHAEREKHRAGITRRVGAIERTSSASRGIAELASCRPVSDRHCEIDKDKQ